MRESLALLPGLASLERQAEAAEQLLAERQAGKQN
jgi:hypothetical protein